LNGDQILQNTDILSAINFSNDALRSLDIETRKFDINIFDTLGMRNLSGLVGEYFAKSVGRFSNDNLTSNLHRWIAVINDPVYIEKLSAQKWIGYAVN
jgi:hypothetical protein